MPKTTAKGATGDIEGIAAPLADGMGLEFLEAAFEKEPAGLYLRLYLDSQTGVTLNDCEAFHRAVQPLLERFAYDFLEVCSPGVDRPIKTRRDAARCMGQQIEVRLYRPRDGHKVFTGELTAYDNGDITLTADGATLVFTKREIALARRVVDMDGIENVDLS